MRIAAVAVVKKTPGSHLHCYFWHRMTARKNVLPHRYIRKRNGGKHSQTTAANKQRRLCKLSHGIDLGSHDGLQLIFFFLTMRTLKGKMIF
jgi:hypothetical protein